MFQMFQRARFRAWSGWGYSVSADFDAVGETRAHGRERMIPLLGS